jgi:hypothetical protein
VSFLLKIDLFSCDLFNQIQNFRIAFSISVKNAIGIQIEIALIYEHVGNVSVFHH